VEVGTVEEDEELRESICRLAENKTTEEIRSGSNSSGEKLPKQKEEPSKKAFGEEVEEEEETREVSCSGKPKVPNNSKDGAEREFSPGEVFGDSEAGLSTAEEAEAEAEAEELSSSDPLFTVGFLESC
jgi:hypothetical protein